MTYRMKMFRGVSALLFVSLAIVAQAQITVSKVEPPNWWAGLPENPMLLLYGAGLSDAHVTTNYPGVTVDRVEPANEGYLFVFLKMAAKVKPGIAKFSVAGKTGSAGFEFPIAARGCGTEGHSSPGLRASAQN